VPAWRAAPQYSPLQFVCQCGKYTLLPGKPLWKLNSLSRFSLPATTGSDEYSPALSAFGQFTNLARYFFAAFQILNLRTVAIIHSVRTHKLKQYIAGNRLSNFFLHFLLTQYFYGE
jgi:hypothetical protein